MTEKRRDATNIEPEEGTPLEELSDQGVGMGATKDGEPNTFEPEEDPEAEA